MSEPRIWGTLNRAVNDATLIDEAIDQAIVAHNDNVDAHLGADQSLQSHRASVIIDHIAESVVNDKIARMARAYVAIVGSGLAGDFDTIQGAVSYAIGVGGGTIWLVPGTYYLSGAIALPANINIASADSESAIVHGGFTGGNYFKIVDDATTAQTYQSITNITFINDGGGVFHTVAADLTYSPTTYFINCIFDGGGQYIYTEYSYLNFVDCVFYASNVTAIRGYMDVRLDGCRMSRYGTATDCYLFDIDYDGVDYAKFFAINSTFDCGAATTMDMFHGGYGIDVSLLMCNITKIAAPVGNPNWINLVASRISTKTNTDFALFSDGQDMIAIGCTFLPNGTGKLTTSAQVLGLSTCLISGDLSGIDNSVGLTGELLSPGFVIHSAGYLAMALAYYNVAQISPNSTRTVTTTVPHAGARRTLIILTSGTTSYTITFGTGFKAVSTLATGTTSARRFVFEFISDGTYLIETSRTTAIA